MLESISFVWEYLIPFLVVLSVLVFVHELGHFLIARWCGVRVEVFSIGFGRELFGRTDRRGTRWRFSMLPLGGYVRMLGGEYALTGAETALDKNDPAHARLNDPEFRRSAFPFKPLWRRAAIVAGGPIANFLFAIIVLALFFVFVGERVAAPVAGRVAPDGAAQAAGVQDGDRFLELDGARLDTFLDLQRAVQINRGTPMEAVIQRGGSTLTLTVTPRLTEVTNQFGETVTVARIGVQQTAGEYVALGPVDGLWRAVEETYAISVMTMRAVAQIIVGSRSTEDVGGVIRIAEMSGEVAQIGWVNLINFMALLSISLGLINLMPIPMLDGGHLVFYAFEAARGRPLSPRIMDIALRLGLALVLGLFLTTTVIDVLRFDSVLEFFDNL